MSLDPDALKTLTPVVVVTPKRRGWGLTVMVAVVLGVVAVAVGARGSGYRVERLWQGEEIPIDLVSVDSGTLAVYVVETGTLESATNTSIKCQVEALIGSIGGTSGSGAGGRSGSGGTGSGGAGGGSGGAGGTNGSGGSGGQGNGTAAPVMSKSKSAAGARSKSGGGSSKSSSSSSASSKSGGGSSSSGGSSAGGGATGGSTGGSGGGASSGGSASADMSGSITTRRPMIRSFSMQVAKYQPLRPATSRSGGGASSKSGSSTSGMGGGGGGGGGNRGGGGGGGGRGGRGGGGGGNGQVEKAGSTRIISIIPEGSHVDAGQIVCELDAANFKDELQAEQIKYTQAKAWVEQAKSIYEVNEITFREYRDGIYPQDVQLIKQYITTCEIESDRAKRTEEWSKETFGKGFRASAQYQADYLEMKRAEMSLAEAHGMQVRLEKYTAPRLLKSLQAKLEAIRADKLAQEAAFGIESDRLKRLEKMVANCTIRAPKEGVIVYANQSNQWSGQTEIAIQEGVTVREGQPLFDLPDPKNMRIRAKVNESKMAFIRPGQKAEIRIDAFPGQVLQGTVSEITPIPASQGRFSDIKIYFATVSIDTPTSLTLRPGLTAEVSFYVDSEAKATRVPVSAVRWEKGQPFVAVAAKVDNRTRWDWRPITVGMINENFAEIVKGLSPGEKVVAKPESLPAPTVATTEVQTASQDVATPRG